MGNKDITTRLPFWTQGKGPEVTLHSTRGGRQFVRFHVLYCTGAWTLLASYLLLEAMQSYVTGAIVILRYLLNRTEVESPGYSGLPG
jgi:hypothetical protein